MEFEYLSVQRSRPGGGHDLGWLVHALRSQPPGIDVRGVLYELTHRQVEANLRKLGWLYQEIVEVIPDAYLTLFRKPESLTSPEQVVAWLTTVAKRQLMKKPSRPREIPVDDKTEFSEVADQSATSSPEAVADETALRMYLHDRLQPDAFQVVDLLTTGYTPSEVTAKLGIRSSRVAEVRAQVWLLLRDTDWGHISRPSSIIATPQPEEKLQSVLENAIRRLPDRQREVLNYHVYAGMKPKNIAAQLQITPNAARVILHNARQSLAKRLRLSAGAVNDLLAQLAAVARREPTAGESDTTQMIAVVFDVARLSQRPVKAREPIRRRLRELVDRVLPEQALATITGDAVLVFVPMQEWKPGFVAALTMRTQRHLDDDNLRNTDKLQLRVLLNNGLVNIKAKAFSSALAIDLLRLSESDAVRQSSRPGTANSLTMFVADRVHDAMLRGHALPEGLRFAGPVIVSDGHTPPLKAWQLVTAESCAA